MTIQILIQGRKKIAAQQTERENLFLRLHIVLVSISRNKCAVMCRKIHLNKSWGKFH